MPVRAPTPCRQAGCAALCRNGSGYCKSHKQQSGWSKEGRGTRHDRGYGTAWVKLRRRILQRDKGLCQPCLTQGIATAANAVDHIAPKAQGGTDATDNLQAICNECHKAKTQAERLLGHGSTEQDQWNTGT